MGKSGKLFASLVSGVKGLKSPSTREKSTKENAHARKERGSSVSKQGCMWSLGKSSSRNKSHEGVSLHPGVEVKDVQVQQLSQDSQPPASSFHYAEASLDEITSKLVDEIVREEPSPHESYEEDWAAILKLSDEELDSELYLTHNTLLEEQAAVRIQAAVRRYLVQQKFRRTVEAVIRLQAIARGRIVRKQAAISLQCILALVKLQANARGWLVRTSEVGQRVRQCLEEIRPQDPMLLEGEFRSQTQDHSKTNAFALDEQLSTYSSKQNCLVKDSGPDKEDQGWAWLNRWMAARPWENSSSLVTKEKPVFPSSPVAKEKPITISSDSVIESSSMIDAGAEIMRRNSEKQTGSASWFQEDNLLPSANMLTIHEVPPPPPPPPLPSFIKVALPLIEHPGLYPTEESTESATLHPSSPTSMVTGKASESASFCMPPTTTIAVELAASNITRESGPSINEESSISSTPVASEVSLPTLAHAEEPEEIMQPGTPVERGALQAEAAHPSTEESVPLASSFLQQNESSSPSSPRMKEITLPGMPVEVGALQAEAAHPSVEEYLPPASSFLAQNEPSSVSSFTMKEEVWGQNSTPTPSQIAEFQGEDGIDSAEPGVNETDVLSDEPARPTDEEKTVIGTASEVLRYDTTCENSTSGRRDSSLLSNTEAENIAAEAEETVKNTKDDSVEDSNDTIEGYAQVRGNGLLDASVTPTTLSEAPAKQMGSILVKHEQGEGVSQRLPNYMATTKSSKAKTRSQASPKPMPESPKHRLVSPKHSSGSKRTPGSEGKGSFVNSRQIVHVPAGSKGQLVSSSIKDGSTSSSFRLLGDSKRHTK